MASGTLGPALPPLSVRGILRPLAPFGGLQSTNFDNTLGKRQGFIADATGKIEPPGDHCGREREPSDNSRIPPDELYAFLRTLGSDHEVGSRLTCSFSVSL